jgi:L-malate glycosyltransferase
MTSVLFVVIELSTGGTERVVLELLRNLDRNLFKSHVVFFIDGPLRAAYSEASAHLIHIAKNNGFDFRAMMKIAKVINEQNIDVINAHHYMPLFYCYLGSKIFNNRSLVYTEHSVPGVEAVSKSFHRQLCNRMLGRTDAVIGVSLEVTESLKKFYPRHEDRIYTVRNGVDVARFASSSDRMFTRSGLGLLAEHFVIGNVANFRSIKNHLCLIRAFKILSRAYPHARLVLVGKGYPEEAENTEQEVKEFIKRCALQDRVIITGERQDIPELLHCFDAFCLPSFSEGLPVSILEAMAARLPVVASDVRGIREVVSHKLTGLLFPSDEHEALARILEDVINDPSIGIQLSERAFDFVNQKHGIDTWISLYSKFLGRNLLHISSGKVANHGKR